MKRFCVFLSAVAAWTAWGETVRFDFESGDLQGWRVTEGAFEKPVTDLALEHNTKKPYTKAGRFFVSTLETRNDTPNDHQVGVIESPLVRLASPKVSFRIGGGTAGVAFELVDRASGKTLASAVGANGEPMREVVWNVPEAVGKDVFFRVTDASTGSWGHLTLDEIVFDGTVGAADFAARAAEAEARSPTEWPAPGKPRVLIVEANDERSIAAELAEELKGRVSLARVRVLKSVAKLKEGSWDVVILQGMGLDGTFNLVRRELPDAKVVWSFTTGGNTWGLYASGCPVLNLTAGKAAEKAAALAPRVLELAGAKPVDEAEFAAAEAAVRELGDRFADYPAAAFLAELKTLRASAETARVGFEALREKALVRANPIVNAHEIAFAVHGKWRSDHHNTATLFQCGEVNAGSYDTEGSLRAVDPKTGKARDIVPLVKERTVRDPEVDYDGSRLVFSMRAGRADDYHIYEVKPDGSGLRQLTREKGVSDIDPVYLPDGDIVFSSTRNPKYCMCNRHIMGNLYRMKGDGANIHQIGVSTLFEGHAAVLPDGRILYDRWEYVDRNFGDAQGLWVCNPDGTRHAIYWGNNTTSPGGVINARPIPGGKVIASLGSCHDRPWGALGIIDRARGVDGQEPVVRTWPADYRDRIHAGGREDFDSSRTLFCKYADPYPLDSAHFLCTRQTGRGDELALYYLDLHGNEVLVHRDVASVYSPVVIASRPRPRTQAVQRNFKGPNASGRFLVQDVYVGTHMAGVKRGTIKALRIVESPEKRNWTGPQGWFGHGEMAPAMNWHSFENKRVLGTVPVEADGSAYFELPANTFVYFQALDAEGKMVQSMRSGAYVQPGELYGCVGCHENRVVQAPPAATPTLAAQRAPSKLDGAYNLRGLERGTPPHFYSFQREVQPVFDRSCVKCHDYGTKGGEKLNLSGDLGAYFATSYVDLWARGAIKCIGGGPAETQPAYSWGSHASKLTKTLYGHGGVQLSEDDRDRIITWMDINAPYYPQYETAYPATPGGRCPLTREELAKLAALTGVRVANSHAARQREQLDFIRPECSRILVPVKGKAAYYEALALIAQGAARLAKVPRCDMEGFVPCEKDRLREARYQRRLESERKVYGAIGEGRKVYDD